MKKDNKRFVVESNFIKVLLDKKLSLNEFLLMMYFDNEYDPEFNVSMISKLTNLKEEDIMLAFSSLVEKKLIKIEIGKNEANKPVEKISLDKVYEPIIKNKETEKKEAIAKDIYSSFEQSFGRTLSPMDYEVINAWTLKGFSEELILSALEEANYNGVKNLRYIDKILYEWNKKGVKVPSDVNKKEANEEALFETNILNFDWLDNE